MIKFKPFQLLSGILFVVLCGTSHVIAQPISKRPLAATTAVAPSVTPAELDKFKKEIASEVVSELAKIDKRPTWLDPSVLVAAGAFVLSIASLSFTFYQFQKNRADTLAWKDKDYRAGQQAKLLESLKWFEGKIQTRAIGIAVIGGNWDRHCELRHTWASVLLSQAVYIVSKPEASLPDHEAENLRGILEILKKYSVDLHEKELVKSFFVPLVEAIAELDNKSIEQKPGENLNLTNRTKFTKQVQSAMKKFPALDAAVTFKKSGQSWTSFIWCESTDSNPSVKPS